MAKFYAGEKPMCPHCDTEQPHYVEDYVVRGRIGPASIEQEECEFCNRPFTVMAESVDEFIVEKA